MSEEDRADKTPDLPSRKARSKKGGGLHTGREKCVFLALLLSLLPPKQCISGLCGAVTIDLLLPSYAGGLEEQEQ